MLLYAGDRSLLVDLPWYCAELANYASGRSTFVSTIKRLARHLGSFPVEVYIPQDLSDANKTLALRTGNLIFIRAETLSKVKSLTAVAGVQHLVTKDGNPNYRTALRIDDDFVQTMLAQEQKERAERAASINLGSWVRIIDGTMRDLHGTVTALGGGTAVVTVKMLTRTLLCEEPLGNLLPMDHVPQSQRVWFYCDTVREFDESRNSESPSLIGLKNYHDSGSAASLKMWANLSLESRERHRQKTQAAMAKNWAGAGPRRSTMIAAIRKGREAYYSSMGKHRPDDRTQAKQWYRRTPEQQAAHTAKMVAGIKRFWATASPERKAEISAMHREVLRLRTPEERKAIGVKSAETSRRKKSEKASLAAELTANSLKIFLRT